MARIRQSVHRELRLNAELAAEVADVHGKQADLCRALLTQMPVDMFNAVSVPGLPLTKIFPSTWSMAEDPPSTIRIRQIRN